MKTIVSMFLTLLLSSLGAEMTTFLLMRHGETDANVAGITSGWTDIPLNHEGKRQAKELGETLLKTHPDIAAIYSSDLSRAAETAEPIASLLEIPVLRRFNLREMYFGDGEGCSAEQRAHYFSLWKSWDEPIYPKGETYNELIARMRKELSEIASRHPGQKVAIFTHGRCIHALMASIIQTHDFPIPENCKTAIFTLHNTDLEWIRDSNSFSNTKKQT